MATPTALRWFGTAWPSGQPALVCSELRYRVPTPVGDRCAVCETTIRAADSGVIIPHESTCDTGPDRPYHRHCLRPLFGIEERDDDDIAGYSGAI